MYLLIIILPFINYFINIQFGSQYLGIGCYFFSLLILMLTLLLICIGYYEILFCGININIELFNWIKFFTIPLEINWTFIFDGLTISMCFIIVLVSCLVHIYSIGYMAEDPNIFRFLSYLSLFTFFMLLLVTGNNLIIMFMGWEGVGLASYLLISFWNTRVLAIKSAFKAMLVNKIGDILLLISFGLIFYKYNSFDYNFIFYSIESNFSYLKDFKDILVIFNEFFMNIFFYLIWEYKLWLLLINFVSYSLFLKIIKIVEFFLLIIFLSLFCFITSVFIFIYCCFKNIDFWIGFCLFLGAMGKSAQIGFHTWLPDAMEGPTPVSALIHAATMVTAGVFLIIRCSPLINNNHIISYFIIIVGAITAIFSGTIALLQYDMKKIIAYSTCSQLGYMFLSCGLLQYDIALFHLINHAFFKALLFLSSGIIIHGLLDEQDIRKTGFLFKFLPYTYVMVLIGSFALSGIPFFTGYYSKDTIIEIALGSYTLEGNFAYGLGILGAFLTSIYSIRLVIFIFFTNPVIKKYLVNVHEGSFFMLVSLIPLSIFSLYWGYLMKDLYIGIGTDTLSNIVPLDNILFDKEILILDKNSKYELLLKNGPFLLSILGFIYGFYLLDLLSKIGRSILKLIFLKYWYDYITFDFKFYLSFKFIVCKSYLFYLFCCLFNNKWQIDKFYNLLILKILINVNKYFILLDRGFVDWIPLNIIIFFNKYVYLFFNFLQSGYIFFYIYLFIISTISILYFI